MKKIILCLCLCCLYAQLNAQDSTKYNFNFNHIALSVTDPARSVAFYTKLFQWKEITKRTALQGIRWISMGEGKELHLISILKEKAMLNKAVHLSFATTQIDAFEKKLLALKIPFSDWPGKSGSVQMRADGVKQIYFQDPDGYWIEVNNDPGKIIE